MYEREDLNWARGKCGRQGLTACFISHKSRASACLSVTRVASVKLACARISCLHPDSLSRREKHYKLNTCALQVWESRRFHLQTGNPGCLPRLAPFLGRSNLQRSLAFSPPVSQVQIQVISNGSISLSLASVRQTVGLRCCVRMFCKRMPCSLQGIAPTSVTD